ncbi:MBL fold metallo-hydrolase, partial [Romboutsia sp.]|uniref:MBL fold metallo-hydrolase n=1 Tax=Romboutsia sp. TaxID=1965302 RepID=UPI002C677258
MGNKLKNIEIANGIYWVGDTEEAGGLHCNPYLIIDQGEGVLIDPGSVLDFEKVFSNVTKLIPLENIKHVILHHQDPDFCSSVPLFEKKGLQAQVVTHWRTSVIVKYYGIKSPYYIVNQKDFKLTLSSGRTLMFVSTPYLHFPGSIATYDIESKTLFSSDLFGAFSNGKDELFAKEGYMESMKAFHEHYMPGNEILRPVMEIFLTMDILRIAPQHGCVIEQDIKTYIKALRDLECGTFLDPIKKEISKTGGYLGICNQVVKRLCSVLKIEEIKNILQDEDIVLDEQTGFIEDFNCTGKELWNKVFELLYKKKGIDFLTIMEPFAQKISKEYDILLPEILNSKIFGGEKKITELSEKNRKLMELNEELKRNVQEIQNKLTKCPITGLYNEAFFFNYLDITFDR